MRRIALLCLLCTLGTIVLQLNRTHPASTSSGSVQANTHPRLLFKATDVPDLQTKAATTHKDIWDTVIEYTESELGTAPPAQAPANGGVNTYRYYGNKLIPFALACAVTERQDCCNLAKTYLLTYASWDQWGEDNKRDLGHAHLLLGNALAYDWIYNHLTPAERRTVRDNLADWAHKMYEASSGPKNNEWGNWWSNSYIQNHFATNHSALGIAGLALLGEDDRAQMWIDQASGRMVRLRDMLNGMEDGSWHESVNYQNYMLTTYLPFAVALRKIQGIDILPDTYLSNYPYWQIYNHLPDSTEFVFVYGDFEWDWGNGYRPQNVLRFIASEYESSFAQWLAQELAAHDTTSANQWTAPWDAFGVFYYDPSVGPLSPASLDKARVFPDLEGVILRTGWEKDDLVFALKAGTYGGRFAFETFVQEHHPWETPCVDTRCQLNIGHDHDDTNGFYLYRAGSWLAPESVGVANSETAVHNTLLVDNQGQYRPPFEASTFWRDPDAFRDADGFLEATASTRCFDYVAANATRRYKNISGLEDITRYVVFLRPDYFVMLDNVAADAAHDYEWISHFGESVSVQGNWVRGDAIDDQILGIGIAAPQPFETNNGNDGHPYVRIRPASPAADVRFINVLYPTQVSDWATRPGITMLDDTGEAVGIRVQRNDGSGLSDDILVTYAEGASTVLVSPYQYDARVSVVTRDTAGELDKLFVHGGTFLADQDGSRVLVTNLNQNEPFEAIYFDDGVVVSGDVLTEVTLYAPQAETLILNGRLQSFTRSGEFIVFDGSELGGAHVSMINMCTSPSKLDPSGFLLIVLKGVDSGE
jgi:hypothetical protein